MRGILHLIRRDLRHSVMNVMAIIVMFGLVVIPSLFTWFNVLASWDPFGNTKNRTVAVASTDEKLAVARDIGAARLVNHRAGDLRAALKAEHGGLTWTAWPATVSSSQ